MPTIVLFDAFGTLLHIPAPSHPYRRLLQEGLRHGRRPRADDVRTVMTRPLDLAQAADCLGIDIQPERLAQIQADLDAELARIEAFADGVAAVQLLQQAGVRVAVCSNLAAPYAQAVRRLYPGLDGYGFSFELGAMKPEPAIYQAACAQLQAEQTQRQVFMVGDSPKCDRDGPRALGMEGFLLARTGAGDFPDLMAFADSVLKNALAR